MSGDYFSVYSDEFADITYLVNEKIHFHQFAHGSPAVSWGDDEYFIEQGGLYSVTYSFTADSAQSMALMINNVVYGPSQAYTPNGGYVEKTTLIELDEDDVVSLVPTNTTYTIPETPGAIPQLTLTFLKLGS